uniref:Uncharacterized protein n=2 Tax=Anguilla anguilla TaxID=7936 RepID=A0A0E9QVK6_ANGAN
MAIMYLDKQHKAENRLM